MASNQATGTEKTKAIEAARLQIEKQFGKGSIMKLGENRDTRGIETIGSGSILLDEALGLGGFPKGRIIEIYGPESSGKTTLALHAIAEAQKAGGSRRVHRCRARPRSRVRPQPGVDTDGLLVSQPDNGEQALEIAEASGAKRRHRRDCRRLTPQAEIEGVAALVAGPHGQEKSKASIQWETDPHEDRCHGDNQANALKMRQSAQALETIRKLRRSATIGSKSSKPGRDLRKVELFFGKGINQMLDA
jgi:RecA/RadA recombinase